MFNQLILFLHKFEISLVSIVKLEFENRQKPFLCIYTVKGE